jgi:hypothetical protein
MRLSVFCFALAFLNCSVRAPERGIEHPAVSERVGVAIPLPQEQPGANEAGSLVKKLQSEREPESKTARRKIRALARRDPNSREQVIRELITFIEGSTERRRMEFGSHYVAWEFAVRLVGELRATEAIDDLIGCIDCNDGVGGLSTDGFPALSALISIGKQAVPKLKEALYSDRPRTRAYAALGLSEIGGKEAKEALEAALRSEHDEEVLRYFRVAVRPLEPPSAEGLK